MVGKMARLDGDKGITLLLKAPDDVCDETSLHPIRLYL